MVLRFAAVTQKQIGDDTITIAMKMTIAITAKMRMIVNTMSIPRYCSNNAEPN